MAVFALCAKDPVKERRAHARQCLLKNISVRREYIKQNPMAHGRYIHTHSVLELPCDSSAWTTTKAELIFVIFICCLSEKLLSLLPEYVVPYMIHLLAHDPDFTKPQDFEQLRDIKEYEC